MTPVFNSARKAKLFVFLLCLTHLALEPEGGIEPPTSPLPWARSDQLSYPGTERILLCPTVSFNRTHSEFVESPKNILLLKCFLYAILIFATEMRPWCSLVNMPPCHGGDRGFKSLRPRIIKNHRIFSGGFCITAGEETELL